jgi:argininosuccinate lyase
LDDLTLEDFKAESDLFEEDITQALDLESIVAARNTLGGTGNNAVREQMQLAEDTYTQDNDWFFE